MFCSVFLLTPLNTSAKLKTDEADFYDQPAGNLLESFKYEEVDGGVSLKAYIKFSNGSGVDSFDFFIVRADGTLIHDEVAKSNMSHTSSGSYYYYTLKTVVNAGERIKAGCYAVSDDGLKSDADCLSIAIEVTVAEAVVLDSSKAGKQCEKCGSTNYKEIGRTDYTKTMHTMEYQCKDCAHCWEVTEEHEWGKYKSNNSDYHARECKICGLVDSRKCKFKVVKASPVFYKTDPEHAKECHNATYKCTVCGFKKTEKSEKHTGKHKCSVCGWTDKKPGNPKNVKLKVKSTKYQDKTFTSKGHWDNNGNWVPAKTTSGSYKICQVAISFTPPKDGYYYIIRQKTGSGTTAKTVWTTKKTSGTYKMWFTSSDKKAKIEIDVYNKNGIKRTLKKTISV